MRRMPHRLTLLPTWRTRCGAALLAISALPLAGCTHLPAAVDQALPADALLLGEQHDVPEHQRLHRDTVQALAARGQLAAVALEMADQGASTQGLPRDADEAAVRQALRWNDAGWPWAAYGPTVMAAVRAGVPVLGANLPRAQMRAAMADESLDARLPAPALARQREAIRSGHCDLMPPAQIAPMARIQIARDRAMADTVSQAAQAVQAAGAGQPARTVVLVAGHAHVDTELGVPQHLPPGVRAQAITWPKAPPARDYCADLRRQMQRPAQP
jgi:uncharacterized iron-regulated protein